MSRDFELLQRIEEERVGARARPLEGAYGSDPFIVDAQPAHPEPLIPYVSPGEGLEPGVRQEIAKFVQRALVLPANAPNVVVLAGIDEMEGSSMVTACSGETLASISNGRVCVVDANFRAPSLNGRFGLAPDYGLVDALIEHRPARAFTKRLGENLWFMGAGPQVENREALLASDRMRGCLAELRSSFEFVLMDAPPLALGSDAAWLGQLADGLVLVVKANATGRDRVQRGKEVLDSCSVRLLGAVLIGRTFPIPAALYARL